MGGLRNWEFDPTTAVITVLIAPVFVYLLIVLRRFVTRVGRYALEGVLYEVSRIVGHRLASRLTLRRYCRIQLSRESLRLLHVPSVIDVSLDIDSIFVPLRLETSGSKSVQYRHNDLVRAGARIRIVGDPGSGKTSLVKKIFRDSCQIALHARHVTRFPVLCELKTIQFPPTKDEIGTRWLYDYLKREASQTDAYQVEECFDAYARASGLLVLLDGLDEVSTLDYPKAERAILGLSEYLAATGTSSAVILTMRTQFHAQVRNAYTERLPEVLSVAPFTPTNIYEFLTRWPFQNDSLGESTRLLNQLTDRPTLREMCTNPLVLSMYVAEDQGRGGLLSSETRTDFYKKVSDELLVRRRIRQKAEAQSPTKLRDQREQILGKIALRHLKDPSEPANTISWDNAVGAVEEVLGCSNEQAVKRLRELSRDTGLLGEERPGESLRFPHLTFCEFFAAVEAVQGDPKGVGGLLEAHRTFKQKPEPQVRTRLVEVIPFAVGLLPRGGRSEAINHLLDDGDAPLVARAFLETKAYEDPGWKRFATSEQQRLLSGVTSGWGEEWLRDLHLFAVAVTDAKLCANQTGATLFNIDLEPFLVQLAQEGGERLNWLIAEYARRDAPAALRVASVCNVNLARELPEVVINNADQPAFFAVVLDACRREADSRTEWVWLLAQAGLSSDLVRSRIDDLEVSSLIDWDQSGVKRTTHAWSAPPVVDRSSFTELISLAVASSPSKKVEDACEVVRLLAKGPAPAKYQGQALLLKWAMVACGLLVPALYLSFPLFLFLGPRDDWIFIPTMAYGLRWVPGFIVVAMALGGISLARLATLRRAYLCVAGPESSLSRNAKPPGRSFLEAAIYYRETVSDSHLMFFLGLPSMLPALVIERTGILSRWLVRVPSELVQLRSLAYEARVRQPPMLHRVP